MAGYKMTGGKDEIQSFIEGMLMMAAVIALVAVVVMAFTR